MYRRLYLIGIFVYMALLVLAIIFYRERVIMSDTAATLFNIVKDKWYSVQLSRLSAVFTESFPLISVRSGFSWGGIMVSYSIAFIIFYFCCYLACGLLFRKYEYGLVILLINILFVSDSFYWIISELPQGMAFLMVILAAYSNHKEVSTRALPGGLLVLAIAVLCFFHPIVVFPVIYSVGYFILQKETGAVPKAYYGMAAIFFFILTVKTIFFHSAYDMHAAGGLKHFVTLFPNYFTLYSDKRFLAYCFTKYYWIPLLFTGIIALYIVRRHWQKAVFFICFFMGYLLLVNVAYPSAATPVFYIENLYLPLSIFLALPFIFEVLPALEKRKMALPVMVLIAITGITRICAAGLTYTTRLNYERKYLDRYGDKKVVVKVTQNDNNMLQMVWGTPYELLLLSESERDKAASIIIDDMPQYRKWAAYAKNELIVNWAAYPYRQLATKYFHFTDTSSGYTIQE